MKKYTSYILPAVLGAAMALLAGCTKEQVAESGSLLRIEPAVAGASSCSTPLTKSALVSEDGRTLELKCTVAPTSDEVATKGDLISAASGLQTVGRFDTYIYGTPALHSSYPQTVTYSGGKWNVAEAYMDGTTSYKFYAVANLPTSGATASVDETDGVSLSVTSWPGAIASQTDVMLGYYKGTGSAGAAAVKFYHPMTSVKFVLGSIEGSPTITGISLQGVYTVGSTTFSSDNSSYSEDSNGVGIFNWTSPSGSTSCTQTGLSVSAENATIGVPFILIPQALGTQSVKVTISTSDGYYTATLDSGTWAAGYTYTYTVGYSSVTD